MDEQKEKFPCAEAFKLWMHAEDMGLRRFQLLAIVEVAGCAGWYLLCKDRHPSFARGLMLFVTFIGVML